MKWIKIEGQLFFRMSCAICLLATIIACLVFQIIPLGGETAAGALKQNVTMLTPPGYIFSAWIILFLLLLINILYQFGMLHFEYDADNPDEIEGVCPFFCIALLSLIVWFIGWQLGRSVACACSSVLALISLSAGYFRIRNETRNLSSKIFFLSPITAMLAWLWYISLLSAAFLLTDKSENLLDISHTYWTIGGIIVLFVAAEITLVKDRGYSFAIAAMLGLFGIAAASFPDLGGLHNDFRAGSLAILAIAILVLSFIGRFWTAHLESNMPENIRNRYPH